MRTIIPAIAIVVTLCLTVQSHIDEARYWRALEARFRQVPAAHAAPPQPASQPTTQPAIPDALSD